jgi:pantothenate kinase
MSAAGQILAQVEEFVQGLLAKVHSHDAEQDARLTALETRVDALEPAKARTSTARAGTVGVKAEAKDSK